MDQFVSDTIRGPEDRVFLLTFDATPHMTDWLNKDQLARTTVQVGVSWGGTALYDSLAIACQQRLGPRDWTKPTRRILVLISDGDDNQSRRTRGEAVSEAQKSGAVIFTAVIFTIDTLVTGVVSKGDKIMADLAELTRGESFDNVPMQDIPKVFSNIRELLIAMYYLSYPPPTTPSKALHEVAVKPTPREKLNL